jgi:hypothetical protein
MTNGFRSSRDVIIRTPAFAEALRFYETKMHFSVTYRSENLVGFETGSFRLYVERGEPHGPVFDMLVSEVAAGKSWMLDAGCALIEEDANQPRCYMRDPYGLTFNIGRDDT